MPEQTESKAQHYLYFSTETQAQAAAKEISKMGLQAEYRLGADGAQWLVLVTHDWPLTPSEFERVEDSLKRVATAHSGEYDGWEVPTG